MLSATPSTRRTFLVELGRGAGALVVLTLAGCVPAASGPSLGPTTPGSDPTPSGPSPDPRSPGGGSDDPTDGDAVAWSRVDLGFVSAYVLARAGEAAVVDTGVAGSADAIEASLGAIGLDWRAVGHVILTHRHGDHVGSLVDVLERAPAAEAYAGADDIPAITSPRSLSPVADGDVVFGLRIVATPGHTPGHVSVLDPVGGILVAGDALNTADGQVTGPNPRFSSDMASAMASVAKVASLSFETLLVGHGDPVEAGAADQVRALAGG